MSGAELAALLPRAVAQGLCLDAYLIAAAMNQIAEDELHRDHALLGAIGDHLVAAGGRPREIVGRAAEATASAVQRARSTRRSWRSLLSWQLSLVKLVDGLADAVVGRAVPARRGLVVSTAESICSSLPLEVRDEVLRLPSCFQAFDLEPADIEELAHRFSNTWAARDRPLLVVGVRTSGSYMAPLCASFLKARGHRWVRVVTLRPEHQLAAHERAAVRAVTRQGGLALVIDDPPGSGRSVTAAVRRLSLDERSIVLLLPLFGGVGDLPPALRRQQAILLPAEDWSIRSKLESASVERALTRLLDGKAEVLTVRSAAIPGRRSQRGHERALFHVEIVQDGETQHATILGEGVGIAYYADHALAVARGLEAHVPRVYGVDRGCLFREWLPEDRRADSGMPSDELIQAVARYVAERAHALPALRDASVGLIRQRPAWEVASRCLSRSFGRGAAPARALFVDRLAKQLLEVRQPSVVDGQTGLSNWFADDTRSNGYAKTGFVEHSFWSLGLSCYDAVFDLAGAAVSSPEPGTAARLRYAYERLAGARIDDERWVLYELAQLWGRDRIGALEPWQLDRARSRALQRYVEQIYLANLEAPAPTGPLCAIDLDGVFETQSLGFPATTDAGARALRALIAHGFRPILVTGRSAQDLVDRCLAYRLQGGVAEYGSVVWTAAPQQANVLVPDSDRVHLDRLRESLTALDGVFLDPSYTYSVRAYRLDRSRRRTALAPSTIAAALEKGGGRLRAVAGATQTDFTSEDVDKGKAVRALIDQLGSQGGLEFAVGDAATDLPMLELAKLALAPRNADAALRRAANVQVLHRPYQSGLALAVARLIGHDPGGCPICWLPPLTPGAALVSAVISAQERGLLGLARSFLRLSTLRRAP